MPAASTLPQRGINRIRAGVVRPRGVRNDDADRRPWARKRPFRTRPAERVVHPGCPCRATSGFSNRDNCRGMSQECARKCRSLRMIEWSRHSRLTLPIRRSTYGFCHGLRGAVTTSSTPIAVTVERNDCPYAPSRSRIRYRGAVPHGNASRICCATHAIVGFAVTPKCTIWRRSWWSTMNPNRRWNVAVGTTKKSIDARQSA